MLKQLFLILICTSLYSGLSAQNLSSLFVGVDTVYSAGAPGNLTALSGQATPIISSSACNSTILHFAMSSEYQNGRVLAMGHESFLSDNSIPYFDNETFVLNALSWLKTGANLQVTLKNGWLNTGNTSSLQTALSNNGYGFNGLSSSINSAALANTDILILGNDWNGQQPYSPAELSAIESFVAGGGGLIIVGLGWSWPASLSDYPMNAVANSFNIAYQTSVISDPLNQFNGSPQFYTFYPDNLNTASAPYCPSPYLNINIPRGDSLRVLRLAVSTNGEFTQQHGGIAATSALINQWLETINATYGREYCVRFELIPNNDILLFPNPSTDPWQTLPAGSGGCNNASLILNDQGAVIDNLIGANNYDISHVVVGAPFGGGCAGSLNSGMSGGLNIPVTRHEMGHQFSQAHTINRGDNQNYEPENGGWSIQGGNAQGHAHAVSYHQLAAFLQNNIPQVGTKVPTGNSLPSVDAGADYRIPISTPFTLRGTGSDSDAGDTLTYIWDNMSPGIAQSIPVADDSQGALFMRLLPSTSPSRTFPKMEDVIANNNSNAQEQLPTQARYMDFRLTVNDNHWMLYNGALINASGINSDDISVQVANAGPFVVTSQNSSGISYPGGSSQVVTWNVNGTNLPPIHTQEVSIHLSTDGGYTYPYLLSAASPNNGSATVSLPNISTDSARIKVAAKDNIYFDLNSHNFSLQAGTSTAETSPMLQHTRIYPNPASSYVHIEVGLQISGHYEVALFNARGQCLKKESNVTRWSISGWPEGSYNLVISDLETGERHHHKLVILHP